MNAVGHVFLEGGFVLIQQLLPVGVMVDQPQPAPLRHFAIDRVVIVDLRAALKMDADGWVHRHQNDLADRAGFLDALKKFPDLKLVSSDQHAGATRELGYQASQNLLNRYGKDVSGIFCPNETVTIAMTKALRDIGRAGGQVKIVGFDSGSQSVLDLKNGDVQALVVQDPVKMGYLGVMTLVQHLQGKPIEKRIDTGVSLVTKENMNEPDMAALLAPPIAKYLKE